MAGIAPGKTRFQLNCNIDTKEQQFLDMLKAHLVRKMHGVEQDYASVFKFMLRRTVEAEGLTPAEKTA